MDRVGSTLAFNREFYANYYKSRWVEVRYDLRYRTRRILHLLRDAGIDPDDGSLDVLEFGFGGGHLLRSFANARRLCGLELSQDAVDKLRDRTQGFRAQVDLRQWTDATQLPFEDNSFSLVVNSHVLEHLEDDDAALGEFIRMLRPGGHLLTILPANEKLFEGSKHLRVYQRDAFAAHLTGLGLSQVRVDEHQRFDRPWKNPRLILKARRSKLVQVASDVSRYAAFLPLETLSWRALSGLDEVLWTFGAPSSSIAYLFRKEG